MKAYIIGNGASRGDFDLDLLQDEVTFGCNALYRDWDPTYLVAIDEGMIQEIKHSAFPEYRFIEPPEDEKWEPAEVNTARPRSNAGMNAMMEAIKRGYDELFCLGFDFLIYDQKKSVSNLYDGTKNYGPETRAKFQDNYGRMNYLGWMIKNNPDIDFYFAFPKNTGSHYYIFDLDNFHLINHEDLL